jgi:hypothetical protein
MQNYRKDYLNVAYLARGSIWSVVIARLVPEASNVQWPWDSKSAIFGNVQQLKTTIRASVGRAGSR